MYSCKPIINVIEILVPNESKKILARFSELLKKFIMFILGLVDDQDHILYINVQLIGLPNLSKSCCCKIWQIKN